MLGFHYTVMKMGNVGVYRWAKKKENIMDLMINDAAFKYGIQKSILKVDHRKTPYPQIKRVLSWIWNEKLGIKLVDIAEQFSQDHSTIHHNVKWMNERMHIMKNNPVEYEILEFLMKDLNK